MNYVFVCHDLESLPPRFYGHAWETIEMRWDRDFRNEGKWRNMRTLLHERDYSSGEWFWFPDPDFEFEAGLPAKLFAAAREYNLDLCQPALTPNSWASHKHLLAVENNFSPRAVPFVEIGCPLFTLAALKRNLWTFGLNYSGFGIDFLWGSKESCHVLDWLRVHHPSSPGYHNTAKQHGFPDPRRELEEVRRLYL